jgi:hypothetical protein
MTLAARTAELAPLHRRAVANAKRPRKIER